MFDVDGYSYSYQTDAVDHGDFHLPEIEPQLVTKCCSVTVYPSNPVKNEAKTKTSKLGQWREERKYEYYIYGVSQSGFVPSSEMALLYTNRYFFRLVISLSNISNISTWAEHLCTHQLFVTFLTFILSETLILYRKKLLFLISLVVVI